MAVDILKTVEIIETMENYLEKVRPPENIRRKLDLGYIIEDQSVILTEIRPIWNNPAEVANATYIKSKNIWKIFWMRANLKWYSYEPIPEVATLKQFLEVVDADKFHCFKR